MRNDPRQVGAIDLNRRAVRGTAPTNHIQEPLQRRLIPAVIHWPSDPLQKFVEWPRGVAKHLHFLARLGQMRSQQDILASRDFLAVLKQIF